MFHWAHFDNASRIISQRTPSLPHSEGGGRGEVAISYAIITGRLDTVLIKVGQSCGFAQILAMASGAKPTPLREKHRCNSFCFAAAPPPLRTVQAAHISISSRKGPCHDRRRITEYPLENLYHLHVARHENASACFNVPCHLCHSLRDDRRPSCRRQPAATLHNAF